MSRAAVIVIGSNSTRRVAADLCEPDGRVKRGRVETRLFLHMENGLLAEEAIGETVNGIRELCKGCDEPLLGIYATSAVRDARNADRLSEAVEAAFRLPLTVLSGEEEAAASRHRLQQLPFRGVGGDFFIAVHQGLGRQLPQPDQELLGQLLPVQDVVVDGAQKG